MEGWKLIMRRIALIAVALLAAGTVSAKPKELPVTMTSDAPVAEQIQRVEAALHSEHYSEISLEDKSRVQQALGRIKMKMEGRTVVSELSPQDRTAVFNDQEVVNTIMTQAKDDSRMVCRREKSTGSNMAQNVCMTVAQRRKATENGRSLLNDQQRVNNFSP